MRNFTIIATNGNNGHAEWEAHRTGCRDIARTLNTRRFSSWTQDAEDGEALRDAFLGDPSDEGEPANLGWTNQDFKLHGCTR